MRTSAPATRSAASPASRRHRSGCAAAAITISAAVCSSRPAAAGRSISKRPRPSRLRLLPARFAQRLRSAVTAVFPADTAGFVRALLLSDRSGLRYAARNELAIAGIYHAVAVSGMHVSILLGMILLLCGGNHPLAAALGLPPPRASS